MSEALDLVKCTMALWGWSDGGEPGSVKRDESNEVIALHGDRIWQADVELASVALMCLMPSAEATAFVVTLDRSRLSVDNLW